MDQLMGSSLCVLVAGLAFNLLSRLRLVTGLVLFMRFLSLKCGQWSPRA